MAKRYGFNEIADSILEAAGKTKDQIEDFPTSNTVSLVPQKPLNATLDSSWPLMTISRGLFEGAAPITAPKTANPDEEKGGWGDDDLDIGNEPKTLDAALASMGIQGGETADAGWGDIDDELGLSEVEHDVEAISSPSGITLGNEFVVPSAGVSTIEQWIRNSPLACDHIAAGAFESAMQVFIHLF